MSKDEPLNKKKPLKPLKKETKTKKVSPLKLIKNRKSISLKLLALLVLVFSVQIIPLPEQNIMVLTHATELYSLAFLMLELWHGFNNRA